MRPVHLLIAAYFLFIALANAPDAFTQAVFLCLTLTAVLGSILLHLGDVIVFEFPHRRARCEFRYLALCAPVGAM